MPRLLLLLICFLLPAAAALAAEPFARISGEELNSLIKKGKPAVVLIDTRSAGEYNEAHIENAVNITFAQMERDPASPPYPKDAFIVFYCTGYS
jgi:rhodanese-related sulfurtransferase